MQMPRAPRAPTAPPAAEQIQSSVSAALLAYLAAHPGHEHHVAASAYATPEVLQTLAERLAERQQAEGRTADPMGEIYDAVAANPHTTTATLALLMSLEAHGADGMVAVAEHPAMTPEMLVRWCRQWPAGSERFSHPDPEIRVRAAIAEREDTPPFLLAELATDSNRHVRAGVVRNPRAPLFLLRQLIDDRAQPVKQAWSWRTRRVAAKGPFAFGPTFLDARHPINPDEHQTRDLPDVAAAQSPDCPARRFYDLSESPDVAVRRAAAGNLGHLLPEELLDDADPSVRLAVVAHPGTRGDELRILAERDPDEGVRQAALREARVRQTSWAARMDRAATT